MLTLYIPFQRLQSYLNSKLYTFTYKSLEFLLFHFLFISIQFSFLVGLLRAKINAMAFVFWFHLCLCVLYFFLLVVSFFFVGICVCKMCRRTVDPTIEIVHFYEIVNNRQNVQIKHHCERDFLACNSNCNTIFIFSIIKFSLVFFSLSLFSFFLFTYSSFESISGFCVWPIKIRHISLCCWIWWFFYFILWPHTCFMVK